MRIILEREHFVVVDKPTGLLSVPGRGEGKQDCAVARVREMRPGAQGPMVVHRLDMETSGLLVVALDAEAQRELSRQFEAREVEKRYEALLAGDVERHEGVIELPLRADISRRPTPIHIVDFDHGKPATTRFRVLSRGDLGGRRVTRVLFEPITGRSHQLRVHAADPRGLSVPILGDPLYGNGASAPRLMLHAAWLVFRDPRTGERFECECPAPF